MKLCRYAENRLGVLVGKSLKDVTKALDALPPIRWPAAPGDHLIRHLDLILEEIEKLLPDAPIVPFSTTTLLSPVANPSKIVAAPLNYEKHVDEVSRDPQIHAKSHTFTLDGFRTPIDKLGLFLKAGSSIVGASEGVTLVYPERRTDHEIELVAIIGREAKDITEAEALDYVCAYCIGLDMTVRGPEDRSFRKSPDSYTVLGPILVTANEVRNPSNLEMALSVNGHERQRANTAELTVGISRMIAIAASCYTLYPGDILMTGTPDGVGEVHPGDEIRASIEGLGDLVVLVRQGNRSRSIHGLKSSAA
jgi:2-keto-4-pentenoate hydratase/2-oxohepta-3-ene-1,7-dioic acid hydratase in catechol pathway